MVLGGGEMEIVSLPRIWARREQVKHSNNNFIKGKVGFLSSTQGA